jgi:HlyD family secretion protein
MNPDKIRELQIDPGTKRRSQGSIGWIFLAIAIATGAAVYLAWPRAGDDRRIRALPGKSKSTNDAPAAASAPRANSTTRSAGDAAPSSGLLAANTAMAPASATGSVLTVSGYIVNRERIEISPRFLGQVRWIGVKKGDAVTNGQILVRLDDAEYQARLKEANGRLSTAKANLRKAQLDHDRVTKLIADRIETKQSEDDALVRLDAARANLAEAEGTVELVRTYLDWTIIRSPVNGVVLEKLVDVAELVTPQSFGGARGPSTALLAIADPQDLQVEIDLNESDLVKVFLNQPCKISPEAYPDKAYNGYVAEIAPEANRQKGTLQVKVQITAPDRFLTPELSAKVDFIGARAR